MNIRNQRDPGACFNGFNSLGSGHIRYGQAHQITTGLSKAVNFGNSLLRFYRIRGNHGLNADRCKMTNRYRTHFNSSCFFSVNHRLTPILQTADVMSRSIYEERQQNDNPRHLNILQCFRRQTSSRNSFNN